MATAAPSTYHYSCPGGSKPYKQQPPEPLWPLPWPHLVAPAAPLSQQAYLQSTHPPMTRDSCTTDQDGPLGPRKGSSASFATVSSPSHTICWFMSERTPMSDPFTVIFAARPSDDKIIYATTDTFIPKRSLSNVTNAAKAFVSQEPWPCTESCTWKSHRTDVPFAIDALTSGPISRLICWLILTSSPVNFWRLQRGQRAAGLAPSLHKDFDQTTTMLESSNLRQPLWLLRRLQMSAVVAFPLTNWWNVRIVSSNVSFLFSSFSVKMWSPILQLFTTSMNSKCAIVQCINKRKMFS